MANSDSPNPTPMWRFWIPLLFQTALILAVPAQAVYTYLTGKTVILQTVPVDPYELLRGYSQTLRYDISSQDSLRDLPGWEQLPKQQPDGNSLSLLQSSSRFHVILEAPVSTKSTGLPQVWKPVAISIERPSQLPTNQVALKGIVRDGFIEYGLETYYIPEDQREEINTDLRTAGQADQNQRQPNPLQGNPTRQTPHKPPVVMEIRVNDRGDAVPISLWARIGKAPNQKIRNYRF
jgi:uncharacterized membrane-anchored protein